MPVKRWSEKPSPALDKAARATLDGYWVPSREDPLELHIRGRCPRCEDPMTFVHPLVVIFGFDRAPTDEELHAEVRKLRPKLRSEGIHVDVRCECDRKHPGAPENSSGCGAPFVMHFKLP